MSTQAKFPAQVRFNWGFHDATSDGQRTGNYRSMARHFDRSYAAGYAAGREVYSNTKVRPESSAEAWRTRCTCRKPFGWHSETCRASVKLCSSLPELDNP